MNTPNLLPLAFGLVLFSFFITSIFLVPFINLLYKLKLTRKKEAPKKGKVPLFDKLHDVKAGTPVGGGILVIAIVLILFLILFPVVSHLGLYITTSFPLGSEIKIIFITFLTFALLGLYDDLIKIFGKAESGFLGLRFGLRRKHKFIIQWILALIIGFFLWKIMGIDILYIPLFEKVIHLKIFYVPLAAFIIVLFSNAVNITDGLDGLASGILLIALLAFWVIASGNLDTPLSIFISLWIGALVAFLYFNVWPARIFMGDTGALAFGAMLAVIGLLTGKIVALFIIGSIFFVEVASSAIQIFGWKVFGKPILPLAPLHNTFLTRGWQEPKVVMRAWIAQIILSIFGLWLASL